ncbi:MAG: FAD-dependent oxidoreductase [Actinomycetota bacterium]
MDIAEPALDQPLRLVILGAGFAGIWAAIAARETVSSLAVDIDIEVIAPQDRFVPRPRLYQANPEQITVPLREILEARRIQHVEATVTAIDPGDAIVRIIDADGVEDHRRYDRLIVATGSTLRPPPIEQDHLHDIDTLETAKALDRRLGQLGPDATVVVVGAGFVGVELACELPTRIPDARIVLLERATTVAPDMGPNPRPVIEAALAELGVEVRTGVSIESFDGATVTLADGEQFSAEVVVWAGGIQASSLTAQVPGDRDEHGRLSVDQTQRVRGQAAIFAAGDTAVPLDESGQPVAQSAQHAMPQGTTAGHNAVADLSGAPLIELTTMPYGVCLDLGAAGAVFTQGWERDVALVGDDAKAIKRDIMNTWLYPPPV